MTKTIAPSTIPATVRAAQSHQQHLQASSPCPSGSPRPPLTTTSPSPAPPSPSSTPPPPLQHETAALNPPRNVLPQGRLDQLQAEVSKLEQRSEQLEARVEFSSASTMPSPLPRTRSTLNWRRSTDNTRPSRPHSLLCGCLEEHCTYTASPECVMEILNVEAYLCFLVRKRFVWCNTGADTALTHKN
ncbi:uncharacterized protein LOC135089938 [Scylla paramamosain]|uniref:uncharacterized protein LOC135089938 n=1 Tax=Scylla paramamosain TaxID=85552 RepID=UPI0030828FAE